MVSRRRAERALERQLAYQRDKAARMGDFAPYLPHLEAHARAVREKIQRIRPIDATTRVLEVGSGAHGLVFFFGATNAIGVDPLADEYRALFPAFQSRAKTVAASGEALPFGDAAFDVVLSDNVVDHAHDPARILAEIERVLAPGGVLYFTVNVHHPIYQLASHVYGVARAIGVPWEIGPFADHTVHLTLRAAQRLVRDRRFSVVSESCDADEARRDARRSPPRHIGDRLKRVWFKNALYELLATRR
jgi:SAM-dependent methyltransferase